MDTDRHARIKRIFNRVCDLPDEERPEALKQACGDDVEMRRELESLIGFHDETEATPASPAPSREPLPERIGEYRVLRKLGEGGMGIVFEVRQDHPVRRKLALKLVKWGMDTGEVLARFESERQALAVMDHPNIAKVFEAGATEQGRPYFTMEYIDGEPLTAYCDRHRLTTEERVELFVQVCDGVQHAHQNGIIHRDIKSSNILVRFRDGRPVPTIIDFGVAKATQQRLTERTLYTERGMLIGTPEYMSPEQAELTGLDVDTRTDVYSLGVVLYELLVGALPFDSRTLRKAGFDEIRRRIREEDPAKPSTRLSTLGDASLETAKRRRTDPAHLKRELSGDMDWITMKALEKNRTRRYASPAEMTADIARHLRHEPVLAGPPGAGYRIGKFARRHRLGVAAGAIVAAALIVGVGMAVGGYLQARRAEAKARLEAARAEQVSELMMSFFDDLNRSIPGHVMTPEQMLDRGLRRIDEQLADEPVLQSRLLGYLAGSYGSMGQPEKALELTERSVALAREHLPPDDPNLAVSIDLLGQVVTVSGDLDRGEALHREALAIWAEGLGPQVTSLSIGRAHQSVGAIRMRKGDFAGARTHLERSRQILDRYRGTYPIHLAYTLFWLGIVETEATVDHRAALPKLREALAILEAEFGADHDKAAEVRYWLGQVHYRLGELDEAERYYEQIEDQLVAQIGLAEVRADRGRLDEARGVLEPALEELKATAGRANPVTAWCARCLSEVYRRGGEVESAREVLLQSVEGIEQGAGPEHPLLSRTLHALGFLELDAGNLDEAERWYRRALEVQGKSWEADQYVHTWAYYRLASIAARRGRRDEALALFRRALECGYDRDEILTEKNLGPLRGDPEFEAIVAEVERRRAA